MKRFILYFGSIARGNCFLSIIFMIAALSFSSCNEIEDINQSIVLSGEWRGDFGMYYDYIDKYGRTHTFDSYDTRITFTPAYSYASHGRGTQVDYYDYGPYEYQYYKFSWSVENGILYLSYDYDHQLDTRISNYRMTNDYFSGTFSLTGTSFRLRKIADYYNWSPYVSTFGYLDRYDWYDYDPYYAPMTRSEADQSQDSIASETKVDESQAKILSRGRRTTPLRQE